MVSRTMSLGLLASHAIANEQRLSSEAHANPIRKVVSLLQKMEASVQAEAEREKKLFENFMCYCKTGAGDLQNSIVNANTKMPQLASDIKKAEEQLVQTKDDLAQAQSERAAAKTAIAEATAMREQQASAFATEKAEYTANQRAIFDAVKALEKGMAGSFLQSSKVQLVEKLAQNSKAVFEDDREKLLSFLSGTQDSVYAPSSGEVTGILKQLGDEMAAGLAAATAAEDAAIASYKELFAAKAKELAALQKAIETDLKRVGDLSIEITQMKNDLTDSEEALMADQKFLAELDKSCKNKAAEWEARVKTRGEELEALAETIKMLNDDDSLELFKKTLPSASASLLQVGSKDTSMRAQALSLLRQAQTGPHRAQLDFIVLALHGKSDGFEKVIGMIDDMVKNLKAEQVADGDKKEYCNVQLDNTDDAKKSLERSVSDEEKAIATATEGIATATQEIADLKNAIRDLDKSVADAGRQRYDENAEYKDLMASNAAAKELIGIAKNRLQKFYNPKLYKAPPKVELSAEDRILSNNGVALAPTPTPGGIAGTGVTVFAQISAHSQHGAAPPPPPETFGAYSKKSEESGGVMAMMDMLVKELDKETTEAEADEKNGQADYEQMIKDSVSKRSADAKALTEKESTHAQLEDALEKHNEAKVDFTKELVATNEYIHSLHLECDWLIKFFSTRKEARESEIDALGNAKAVLSGADYSLAQTGVKRYLRHSK